MTSKRFILALLTALCIAHSAVNAQVYPNTPVTVSSDKVKMNNRLYYAHPVLERQTLYSISKAYGVTIDEIVAANPELDLRNNGMKMGQVLLIPDNGQETSASAPSTAPQNAVKDAKPQQQAPVNGKEGEDYIVYTVKWFDDLGTIAQKYGVSKADIMAYNGMDSEKLGKKQKIKIPVKGVSTPETSAPAAAIDDAVAAAGQAIQNGIEALDGMVQDAGEKIGALFHRKKDEIDVTVILPFNAKGKANDSAYDIYSGMLLAARDLAKSGIATDITVIDNKNALTPVQPSDIDEADIVFGPIAPEDLEAVLARSSGTTAVISPLDPRVNGMLSKHTDLIQAPSSADDQFADIVEWIRQDMKPGDKVVLISEKGAAPTAIARHLTESGIAYTAFSYSILEGRTIAFDKYMSATGVTRAVIASDKEAFVNDAVRNLNLMVHRKFNVVLYGPSKIRNYETIDIESLHSVSAHISSSYFVDYDDARIKNFLLSYRALFGAEPTPFAYQGYDMMWYFVRSYDRYGRNWIEKMEGSEDTGLQSAFRIRKAADGGYSNTAVRRAVYEPDFNIRVIR